MMQAEIIMFQPRIFVGQKVVTSYSNNDPAALWKKFMPVHRQIPGRVGQDLFSIEIYPRNFFVNFHPSVRFEHWAAVEVSDVTVIPADFETIEVPIGQYALFVHRGTATEGLRTYRDIFETWLPSSGYVLDNRPHIAIMGPGYRPDNRDAEEQILIPVKHP
jgi:AraC family transcriptional regulator